MPRQNDSTETVDEASDEVSGQSAPSPGNPELVQQVFGLFKDYLSTQLDVKGKQIETKQQIDKETVELKFKGNRKQFKLNAESDNIFDQIQTANVQAASDKISTLVSEGRKLIHKRQKLIKIADRCKDGWQVVEEYESDELASNSEDEKKLKKAKEAAGRKRKARQEGKRVEDKRQKTFHAPSDHQLFRGRLLFGPGWPSYLYFVNSSSTLLEHPSYNLLYSCFCFYRELKVQNNLRSVERSELERKCIFSWYEGIWCLLISCVTSRIHTLKACPL